MFSPITIASQRQVPLSESMRAIERSINITENLLRTEREALQRDRFGRQAAEMPPHLRKLYQTGSWKDHSVYLWANVLELSKVGHDLHSAAEAALEHISYKSPTAGTDATALANSTIAEAEAVGSRLGPRVHKILAAQKAARETRLRHLSKAYMLKRRVWVSKLDDQDERRTEEEREGARQRDRELLVATRASSGMGGGMTSREIDLIFSEIEAAAGTAGGLERWGRSITGIPDQNPDCLPPASDGGGVLIENPLADHYAARNVNPWTRAERLLFLEKFVIHGKNFRKVATFFEHKSVEDCVRFYFDNKMRLNLKQLMKDTHLRKRGNKKHALVDLSKLPIESRSIKDNFIHQDGFFSAEEQEAETDCVKAEKHSIGTVAKGWSTQERQSLIFALCRYNVSDEEEGKPVSTVWASIAAMVGSKTPRQCRQFYMQYKAPLGLDSYWPPKHAKPTILKRPASTASSEDAIPKKIPRRLNSTLKSSSVAVQFLDVGLGIL